MLSDVGGEIARENPEGLFVTAFAGVLDANTGTLHYSSAGHDAPYVLSPDRAVDERLDAAGGPPLCVVEGHRYAAAQHRLRRGDTLCLFTDGITEAMNAAGQLYGRERLRAVLEAVRAAPTVHAVGEAIRTDVARFVGSAEPADDLTLLVLRWTGP
jgi:adenylate cyclase